MPYLLPNGRAVDREGMQDYLRQTVTRKQIADWIDNNEDMVSMMCYQWPASEIAFAMEGYPNVREAIIEFVEEDWDIEPFGIRWVDDRGSRNIKSGKRFSKKRTETRMIRRR